MLNVFKNQPNLVGTPKQISHLLESKNYIGNQALFVRGALNIIAPIEDEKIIHWNEMEKIWKQGFSTLQVESTDISILISEPVDNSFENKTKMMEIFFETFQVQKYQTICNPICSLFASGRTEGTFIDFGYESTRICSIFPSLDSNQSIISGFFILNLFKIPM
jgi:actin-related protein